MKKTVVKKTRATSTSKSGRGSTKGSIFEREICKKLSLWWTQDLKTPRDDVFWRIGGSGGRAKSRGRRGQGTYGQSGDICATDPIGDPLTKLITFELKKGYNRFTVGDLLDKPTDSASQKYEEWITQAQESHFQSGAFSWMIIHKRDRREALAIMPYFLWYELLPHASSHCSTINFKFQGISCHIAIVTLEDFLKRITPNHIIEVLKEHNESGSENDKED